MILPEDDAPFVGLPLPEDPPPPLQPAFSARVLHALPKLVFLVSVKGDEFPWPLPSELALLFDVLQRLLVSCHARAAAVRERYLRLRKVYQERLVLAGQAISSAVCIQRMLRWSAAHPLRLIGELPPPSPSLVARAARHLFTSANLRPLDDEPGALLPSGSAHVPLVGEGRAAAVSSPAAVLRALLPALEALALPRREVGVPVGASSDEVLFRRLRHVMYALMGVLVAAEEATEVEVVWAEWGQSELEALLLDHAGHGSLLQRCGWLELFAALDASAIEGV